MTMIDRRSWLHTAGAGGLGLGIAGITASSAKAAERQESLPAGIIKAKPGAEVNLAAKSSPVAAGANEFSIVGLGSCKLLLDKEQRLTAVVRAAVTQYTHIEYWISLAVFDAKNRFLGAATHKQAVQYVRLGGMPTMLPEIEFDFGISKRYRDVAGLAVAISDRDVPEPLGF